MTTNNTRVALITGSGGGIGRAVALRLAEDGLDIGVLDLNLAAAQETVALVKAKGRRAFAVSADVSQRESVRAAVARVVEAIGPIDVLMNNAGVLRTNKFVDVSEAEWHMLLGVNLHGVFHCSQAVLPGMIERKSGCIVNMSSWTGKKGQIGHSAYSVSKAGVIALTQAVAAEVAEFGVRVNAVCPGIIVDTQMRTDAEDLAKAQGRPDLQARINATVPMKRAGLPSDIAGVVSFLASKDASYMTGQAINITGGLWMN